MKKRYKSIVIILVFILSFSSISNYQKKEPQAFVGAGILAFKLGASFTAFAGMYQLMQTNGMHMQISDAMSYFTNTFYDKQEDNYVAKQGKVNFLEKLTYMTSAFISGNDVLDQTGLRDAIKTAMDNTVKKPVTGQVTTTLPVIGEKYGIPYTHSYEGSLAYALPYQKYSSSMKYSVRSGNIASVVYVKRGDVEFFVQYPSTEHQFGYTLITNPTDGITTWIVENVKIIFPDGTYIINPIAQSIYTEVFENVLTISHTINSPTDLGYGYETVHMPYSSDLIPMVQDLPTIDYKENSYATDEQMDFALAYPNYYHLLNGQAETIEGLQEQINTNEALQTQILEAIQSQAINQQNTIAQPQVDPVTGLITYPGVANPDIPTTPDITVPEGFWSRVMDIPTDIVGGITGLWENTINPSWDALKDTVTSIPALLTNAWDTIMDVPMESIDLNKLKLDGIITRFPFSIPFDFIGVISSLNLTPKAPDLRITLNTSYFELDHQIDVEPIQNYIIFFRWFVLLTFIIGLMFATSNFIKW